MPDFERTELPLEKLLLDPNNYRFHEEDDFVFAAGHRFHEDRVQEIAWQRLRDSGLGELKNSFLANGFIPVEPVVLRKYDHIEDRFVVLEGNRRIAAIRWIQKDIEAGVDIDDQTQQMLNTIPVVIVSHEEDDPAFYEALMGVRHISGIREWGGYQRAKLVVTLRDERGLDASDIGDRVAMSTVEVNRRYRAFKALEQMQQDEDFGDHATPDLYAIFHEAVSVPVIREWLGWDQESSQFTNEEELRRFYTLIGRTEFDDEGQPREQKIKNRSEVRELGSILPNDEAKRILFDPSRSFVDALATAKEEELARAWTAKVSSAIAALNQLGFVELKNLDGKAIASLQTLAELAQEIVRTHAQITGEGGE